MHTVAGQHFRTDIPPPANPPPTAVAPSGKGTAVGVVSVKSGLASSTGTATACTGAGCRENIKHAVSNEVCARARARVCASYQGVTETALREFQALLHEMLWLSRPVR